MVFSDSHGRDQGIWWSLANNIPRSSLSLCFSQLRAALLVLSSSVLFLGHVHQDRSSSSVSVLLAVRGRRRRGRNLRSLVSPLADVAAESRSSGRDREKQPWWAGAGRAMGAWDVEASHRERAGTQNKAQGRETARWGENQMDPKPGIQSSRSMPLSRVWGSQRRASWEPGRGNWPERLEVMRTPSRVAHLKCLPRRVAVVFFSFFLVFFVDGYGRWGEEEAGSARAKAQSRAAASQRSSRLQTVLASRCRGEHSLVEPS